MYTYIYIYIYGVPQIGIPQHGWFMMDFFTKVDDLGVPLFEETSVYDLYIYIYIYINIYHICINDYIFVPIYI